MSAPTAVMSTSQLSTWAAKEWRDDGKDHHEHDAEAWDFVLRIELAEWCWDGFCDGHGIEQTAAGEIERVEPGYDAAEHGDGQKDEADGTDELFDGGARLASCCFQR